MASSAVSSFSRDEISRLRHRIYGSDDDDDESDSSSDDDDDDDASTTNHTPTKEEFQKQPISQSTGHGHSNKQHLPTRAPPICPLWTYLTEDLVHATLLKCIIAISAWASQNPYRTISAVVGLSLALAGIGCCTNLVMIFDHEEIFTPMNSLPYQHGTWIYQHGGFEDSSDVTMVIHADGQTVLHRDAMRRTFQALQTLQETPGYHELCATSSYLNMKNQHDCWVWSTTQFWKHDVERFEAEISSDEELIRVISQAEFPDGTPVYQVIR